MKIDKTDPRRKWLSTYCRAVHCADEYSIKLSEAKALGESSHPSTKHYSKLQILLAFKSLADALTKAAKGGMK
jgi:hypothetical protein